MRVSFSGYTEGECTSFIRVKDLQIRKCPDDNDTFFQKLYEHLNWTEIFLVWSFPVQTTKLITYHRVKTDTESQRENNKER